MRGELSETSPAALLTALADGRARGRLVVDGTRGRATVAVWDGQVVDATSPAPRARLLRRLLATGHLDPATAADIGRETRDGRDEGAVLDALRRRGAVEADVLRWLRTEQVVDAVSDLLAWKRGRFALVPSSEEEVGPTPDSPRLAAATVLERAGRQRVRLDRLRELVPSLDAVPALEPDVAMTLGLGADPLALLRAIDGLRDLRMLADHLGIGGSDVLGLTAGLCALGLVRLDRNEDRAEPIGEDRADATWDDVLSAVSVATVVDAALAPQAPLPQPDPPEPPPAAPPTPEAEPAPVSLDTSEPGSLISGAEALSRAAAEALADIAPEPEPRRAADDDADVASFLRELSSLALGDDPAPAEQRPRARRQGGTSATAPSTGDRRQQPPARSSEASNRREPEAPRKRRGLFGRG